MIAADTSVLIDFFQQSRSAACDLLHTHIHENSVMLPPVVLSEMLSSPNPQPDSYWQLDDFLTLEITEGYWERAGLLRRKIRQKGLKAALGDALIAQSCIDHGVPLLTLDKDFKHYAKHGGLKLVATR